MKTYPVFKIMYVGPPPLTELLTYPGFWFNIVQSHSGLHYYFQREDFKCRVGFTAWVQSCSRPKPHWDIQGEWCEPPHNQEVVGRRPRATEASAHEPVHHVHGGQLYFHIPHHDGRYAHRQASESPVHHSGHIQDDRGISRYWTETGLSHW